MEDGGRLPAADRPGDLVVQVQHGPRPRLATGLPGCRESDRRWGGGLQGGSGIRAIGCGLGVIDSAMVIKSVEVCRCI